MDTFEKLDKVDLQILRTLQENARLTTKELAARVSLHRLLFSSALNVWRVGIYKEVYRCAGCRKAESGFCGLLQCQAKAAEQGHCG